MTWTCCGAYVNLACVSPVELGYRQFEDMNNTIKRELRVRDAGTAKCLTFGLTTECFLVNPKKRVSQGKTLQYHAKHLNVVPFQLEYQRTVSATCMAFNVGRIRTLEFQKSMPYSTKTDGIHKPYATHPPGHGSGEGE